MTNHFKKTIIRVSFEPLVDQLKAALDKEGFEISGVTDFQQIFMDHILILESLVIIHLQVIVHGILQLIQRG